MVSLYMTASQQGNHPVVRARLRDFIGVYGRNLLRLFALLRVLGSLSLGRGKLSFSFFLSRSLEGLSGTFEER